MLAFSLHAGLLLRVALPISSAFWQIFCTHTHRQVLQMR